MNHNLTMNDLGKCLPNMMISSNIATTKMAILCWITRSRGPKSRGHLVYKTCLTCILFGSIIAHTLQFLLHLYVDKRLYMF